MTAPTLETVEKRTTWLQRETHNVLEAIQEVFDTYVVFPSEEARDAVVLWAAHSHVFFAFEATPRLNISSKEPGSGKSRVLEILEYLVPNPLNAVHITPGVMWRKIEHEAPTILLDEVDTIFGKAGSSSAHQDLRSILNAGHRKGATVPRCIGKQDVKEFSVFSPIAMAGLGNLPDTIATRSIQIKMRKRRPGEEVKPFRAKYADALRRAKNMLENWSLDAALELEFAAPEMPVRDRDADVWEALIAIGELAGPEWHNRSKKACLELTGGPKKKPMSPGVRLLTDVRKVFGEDRRVMFTTELLEGLLRLPETPWGSMNPRKLSAVLNEYGIRPTTVRQGEHVAKGYRRSDFDEAFSRYLPPIKEDDDL